MKTPPTQRHKLSHLARWLILLGLVGWATYPQAEGGMRNGECAPIPPYEQATPDSDLPGDDQPANERRAQLFDALGVRAWHESGQNGRGIKVAILDSGFNGYRAHLGKALPARVTTHSFRLDGNLEARDSQHGILCAEVIHTLAPEAELLLANWEEDRAEQFLAAVRWAKEQGARVISCSVIMPTWSDGEGHSVIHTALARILGKGDKADDVLMFASAGNTAQRHWGGPFRDLGNGFHDWGNGQKENLITPWGAGERVSVELCWQPGTNYELFIDDVTARRSVGGSTRLLGSDRCCAAVRFTPQRGHAYTLRLRRLGGKEGTFHLVVLGGGLQYATRRGSITFPGDGPEVIAVGAVGRTGHRLAYSSCGPNSSLPKPDFVASIPFPSQWRARPFTGTSAAAPQAAAVAALLWARYPSWTANHVHDTLKTACTHLGAVAHSFETGFGLIHLP
jgi:subtilisin family serine protease